MGNQIQSSIEHRSAVVLLQNGVIGKIKEVHAWSGASFPGNGRPAGEDPVPKNLDWDKWLGVAPVRPYKGGVYHPFNWRGWQDFGTGPIGDFMCHIMDSPFKALELTVFKSVIATGVPSRWANDEKINTENWPEWATYEYIFPGTKWTTENSIKVSWYDGGKIPRKLAGFEKDETTSGSGEFIYWSQGILLLPHVGGPQLVPYSKTKVFKDPSLAKKSLSFLSMLVWVKIQQRQTSDSRSSN